MSELRAGEAKKAIGTHAGDVIDLDQISADVHAIWKLGGIRDVRAEGSVTSDGGPVVRFVVAEQPTLRAIDFTGNQRFSRTVLDALLRIPTGEPVDMLAVRNGRAAVRRYYMENGYLRVAVAWRLEDGDAGTELVYDIHEGALISISTLEFEGNTAATDAELAALIRGPGGMNNVGGAYVAELMYDSLAYITSWYYDRGYINVSTSAPSASLSSDGASVEVSVNLDEGDQYRIGAIVMGGDVDAKNAKYRALFQIKTGEIFNRSKIADTLTKLTELHQSAGFPNAVVTPLTDINSAKHTVDLTFEVESGAR